MHMLSIDKVLRDTMNSSGTCGSASQLVSLSTS